MKIPVRVSRKRIQCAHCSACNAFLAKRDFAKHQRNCTVRIADHRHTYREALAAEPNPDVAAAATLAGKSLFYSAVTTLKDITFVYT